MLLSAKQILQLIDDGVIEFADKSCVNSASLDIHLGPNILMEHPSLSHKPISLQKRESLNMTEICVPPDGFIVRPYVFLLAHSREVFHLPNNISAEYKLKSSMARIGLEHMNAGWCDAGWHGSVLTLEFKNMTNYHSIILNKDDKIGQMIFFQHEPVSQEHSYASKGSYNNDRTVSGTKPISNLNK